MVQVCVDCMEKGIMYYKLYGMNLVIPWKQTRLPFTVQFQLTYRVNCRVLLGNVAERTWYKFVLTAWTMECIHYKLYGNNVVTPWKQTALYPVFKKMYHETRGKLFLQRLLPGK